MSRQGNKFACAITALESYYIAYVTQGTGLSKKKKEIARPQSTNIALSRLANGG